MSVRTVGCGQIVGVVLISAGVLFLVVHYFNPWNIKVWWPLFIVAFGVYLLFRHYWRLYRNRHDTPEVIDAGVPIALPPPDKAASLAPPTSAILVIGIGVYWFLVNIGWISFLVIVAVLFILIGFLIVSGTVRGWIRRGR
jgi:hypothetical protein